MNTASLERPMLNAIVTVQAIYPPKPGRKSGTVKDTNGTLFSAFPDTLGRMRADATYELQFTEKNVNGVTYRDIKYAAPAEPLPEAPPNFVQIPRREEARPPRSLSSAATQEPKAQNGNGYYRPTSPEDKKSMFRCACITAAIKSRQVTLTREAIAALIVEIDAGYDLAIDTVLAAR